MKVSKRIGSALVLATAMIASLGISHAQSASDMIATGIGRKPGCGGPAYDVTVFNTSPELYYKVVVDAQFSNQPPTGPAQCSGQDCVGILDDIKLVLPPCGLPGYCAAVDGGDSTGFPTCCNVGAGKCNLPGHFFCTRTDWLEVALDGYSTDGVNWTSIEPAEVVCKYPLQEGYPLCNVGTECQVHPPHPCHYFCMVQ
jgi:hypothetical protein